MRIMDAFSNKDLDCESTKDLVSAFKSFGEVAKKEKSETMNSMAILSNIIAQVTNARLRGGNIVDTSVIQGIEIDPWQDIEFKLE
jgi:hypothetical protein